MGSGVLCLDKEYKEMPFIEGVHLRTWQTVRELINLIDFYLEHWNEREEIAKQGEKFVKENYTFDVMVKNIIKEYEQV
jgi:spore maturation protein CgeB